ncbi:MAG TPA: GNAT family N-acetyltransferase [Clostridium sp.]|uniref:GNAT family N-acetyltransferase n=1 Tax=Clostridium sp. TaxID=1506 RepID=UPI002F9562BC
MYKLKLYEYKKVEHIFKELAFNIVIKSVINGNTPGEIYVDNMVNPKTALVWDMMGELLIEGDDNNNEYNMEINKLIIDDLKPRAAKRYIPCFDFYYSKKFENKLDVLLQEENCTRIDRNVYKFKALKLNWRENIPKDCSMVIINEKLLERKDLKYIESVEGWISSFWHSASDFTSKGVGYCLIKEDIVVSWCLSVFVSGKNFELGLETVAQYRGNGYGKLTAAACIEYCIENNIIPFWQCNKDNIPSNKVSESIGFKKDFQYYIENFQF